MTTWQKAIKYAAVALAIFLAVSIVGGILGALAGVSFLSSLGDTAVGELQSYTVDEDITRLEIDITAARLEIVTGDRFGVESNLKKLTVIQEDGCLRLEEKRRVVGITANDALLRVTLPGETVLDRADITTGAGSVEVDTLCASDLTMRLGAGEVTVDHLVAADEATIVGGAGQVTVADGALNDLDLDMGVGELNLTAALAGDCALACGVGESNLTLLGSQEDYTVTLDKGLGQATVADKAVKSGAVYGTGDTKVDIDGGVGAIRVTFAGENK